MIFPIWKQLWVDKSTRGRHILVNWWPLSHHVQFQGDRLRYTFGPVQKAVKLNDRFFSDFLKIADASADDLPKLVTKFADRYGVLELCERHGLPSTHPNTVDTQHPLDPPPEYFGYCPPRRDGNGFSESLSEWRYWSRQAQALVKVAARARNGEFGPEEDFKFLLPVPREAREIQSGLEDPRLTPPNKKMLMARIAAILGDAWPQSPAEQWKIVALTVNQWLTVGRAQPICTIEKDYPAVILAPGLERGWLFTMLSVQLLVAVTGAKALECCTNCGSFYLPKKVASTGTRRFCPKCGIRAARRLAQADFRKRHG